MGMNDAPSVVHVDRLDLALAPQPWAFADARRADIDARFAQRQRDNPALWNGRVLLLYEPQLKDGVFTGRYLETDFASFDAWRDWGRPPAGIYDCFGAAAIETADRAFLLGVMASHTARPGRIYFPCGTPDLNDVAGARVDLDRSVGRELAEETGLGVAEFAAAPGWTSVFDGAQIAHLKRLRSNETAGALRARILDHLARDRQPELADIRIVRSAADFDPAMPRFVTAFLEDRWR
jgi:hypothetical protein